MNTLYVQSLIENGDIESLFDLYRTRNAYGRDMAKYIKELTEDNLNYLASLNNLGSGYLSFSELYEFFTFRRLSRLGNFIVFARNEVSPYTFDDFIRLLFKDTTVEGMRLVFKLNKDLVPVVFDADYHQYLENEEYFDEPKLKESKDQFCIKKTGDISFSVTFFMKESVMVDDNMSIIAGSIYNLLYSENVVHTDLINYKQELTIPWFRNVNPKYTPIIYEKKDLFADIASLIQDNKNGIIMSALDEDGEYQIESTTWDSGYEDRYTRTVSVIGKGKKVYIFDAGIQYDESIADIFMNSAVIEPDWEYYYSIPFNERVAYIETLIKEELPTLV